MKFKIFTAEYKGLIYRIEENLPEVGWYLFRYENGIDTHDYLQDTLEICKEVALRKWEVPMDAWKEEI